MIALASLLALAAPADPPAQVGRALVGASPISRVWLRGAGLDEPALTQAVAARMTDKQVLGAGAGAEAGPIEGIVALCHVGVQGDALRLEVILGDGRVYQRTIAAPVDGRERAAARLIASTIASIEDETATPDRRDGVFAPPGIETAPVVPESPPVIAAPPVVDTPAPVVLKARTVAPAVKPRAPLELGVAIAGGVLVGLGAPGAGRGLAGGGGELRVDLRLRRGVTLGAGFRGLGRGRDELALGRYRGALLAGYVARRRALEVSALVGPTLETWQARANGEPVAYAAAGASGASLLIGALARIALGGRIVARRGPALRIGGYVEFAGSARASGRAAQIARQHATTPVFVLGGAELAVGVELELWFALPERARRAQLAWRSIVSR